MGNSASQVWKSAFGKKETRILMVGLDAAGKTTILYKMRAGEVETTIPCIGYNLESVKHVGRTHITSFTSWDVGGRSKIRTLYRHFYKEHAFDAVIFVVDSNDRDRMEDTYTELDVMLGEELLEKCPFLVFANKQDLPNSMSVAEIADRLKLHALRRRIWHIQACCANTGDGIWEGMDWVVKTVQQQEAAIPAQGPQEAGSLLADLKESREQSARLTGFSLGRLGKPSPEDHDSAADSASTADTEALDVGAHGETAVA